MGHTTLFILYISLDYPRISGCKGTIKNRGEFSVIPITKGIMKSIRYNKSAIPYADVNSWHMPTTVYPIIVTLSGSLNLAIFSDVGSASRKGVSESGIIICLGSKVI